MPEKLSSAPPQPERPGQHDDLELSEEELSTFDVMEDSYYNDEPVEEPGNPNQSVNGEPQALSAEESTAALNDSIVEAIDTSASPSDDKPFYQTINSARASTREKSAAKAVEENSDASAEMTESQQEQPALIDVSGNVNPDLIETPDPEPEKTEVANKPLSEYSVDELRAAIEAKTKTNEKNSESLYELGQEVAVRRHAYTNGVRDDSKLGNLESGWKIEAINEDGTYLLGQENGKLHDGREGHVQRDGVTTEQLQEWQKALEDKSETDEAQEVEQMSIDYNTRIGNAGDRVSKWLSDKSERYENAGGLKGLANRALRRIGSAAYRLSGLKAGVNAMNKVTDAAGRAIEKPFDIAQDLRIAINERRLAARDRGIKRAQERQMREQTQHEKEVMDYVKSQENKEEITEKGIDLQELVANSPDKARGRHRKANENKNRRRAARAELRRAAGEMIKTQWDTSKLKKIGSVAARFALQAKGTVAGAVSGAVAGARAGASANSGHLSVRGMNVKL